MESCLTDEKSHELTICLWCCKLEREFGGHPLNAAVAIVTHGQANTLALRRFLTGGETLVTAIRMGARAFSMLALFVSAFTARAQPVTEISAMTEVLLAPMREAYAPTFKAEPAQIYRAPYLRDDTDWEKRARTAWYAAQLPQGFPTQGPIEVFYLPRCQPSLPYDELSQLGADFDTDLSSLQLSRAADRAIIRNALVLKGAGDVPLDPMIGRSGWLRTTPDPGLKAINSTLQQGFASGKLSERIAIFEPFCPGSQRGTYAQRLEHWQKAGRRGPEPIPDPAVYPPPPPPPPPPGPPTMFEHPANARVWLMSEFKSTICNIRTGSFYSPSCAWTELLGSGLQLSGRYFRYRIIPSAGSARTGRIDLRMQPSPIRLMP